MKCNDSKRGPGPDPVDQSGPAVSTSLPAAPTRIPVPMAASTSGCQVTSPSRSPDASHLSPSPSFAHSHHMNVAALVAPVSGATLSPRLPPSPLYPYSQSSAPSTSSSSSTSSGAVTALPPTLSLPPSDSLPPPLPVPQLPHELMDAILRTAMLSPPATPTTHPATHILTYLLVLDDLSTSTYQCAMLRLPHASSIDSAASLGRTDVLTKRVQLGLPIDTSAYSAAAIDIACELGHVHVLEWFEHHKLPLLHSSIALMSATLRAHMHVLEWWRARDAPADAERPHSLPSLAGYSVWVASRVGEMRSVRWWAAYAMGLRAAGHAPLGDRVLVDVLDASLHAATFFGHVHVLEYWARGWPQWVRHLVDPMVDAQWGASIPAFAKLEEAAAAAAATETHLQAHADPGAHRRPTFMMRWWQRLLGQVGDNELFFRRAHSQARKELVTGMQWWVHRGAVVRPGDPDGVPLVSEAALEHLKQACLRFAPAKVLRRIMREPKQGFLEGLDQGADDGSLETGGEGVGDVA